MNQGKLIVGSLKNMDDLLVTDFNPSLKNINWDYHSTLERQHEQYLKPNMRNQWKSGYLPFLVGSKIADSTPQGRPRPCQWLTETAWFVWQTNRNRPIILFIYKPKLWKERTLFVCLSEMKHVSINLVEVFNRKSNVCGCSCTMPVSVFPVANTRELEPLRPATKSLQFTFNWWQVWWVTSADHFWWVCFCDFLRRLGLTKIQFTQFCFCLTWICGVALPLMLANHVCQAL